MHRFDPSFTSFACTRYLLCKTSGAPRKQLRRAGLCQAKQSCTSPCRKLAAPCMHARRSHGIFGGLHPLRCKEACSGAVVAMWLRCWDRCLAPENAAKPQAQQHSVLLAPPPALQ